MPPADKADTRSAGWHDDWRSTMSLPPDNWLVCQAAHNTDAAHRPTWSRTLERCIIDDPGFDRSMPLDRRQNQLAHFGQHWLVGPRRIGNKMQQPLMLDRSLSRRGHRRHWLHALAPLCDQQAGAVIIQRPHPVGVADH